ncbi:MFS transporter [Chryseobacterium sp. LC2016-27]|uniref:MFS transporter n=1 Tax=Chryseobacterium sp. LC2016-27 TaxID=2897326 RepID=UPI0021D40141|nr:MFS transporter [Chryseobacterium sp. LC2016-27]
MGNFTFVRLCISFGLESMARYGLIFWVPVHFLGKNWKEDPSFLWVTFLLPLGMAIGAVSFGQLAVSVFKNNFRSITFGMLVCSIISFSLYTFTSSNIIIIIIIIIAFLLIACGFFVYGPQANFWALCPQILGKHKTGTAMGIMNMFGYLCAALIEPILGSVISFSKNTSILFIVIGVLCLAASINTWFLRDAKNVENY